SSANPVATAVRRQLAAAIASSSAAAAVQRGVTIFIVTTMVAKVFYGTIVNVLPVAALPLDSPFDVTTRTMRPPVLALAAIFTVAVNCVPAALTLMLLTVNASSVFFLSLSSPSSLSSLSPLPREIVNTTADAPVRLVPVMVSVNVVLARPVVG